MSRRKKIKNFLSKISMVFIAMLYVSIPSAAVHAQFGGLGLGGGGQANSSINVQGIGAIGLNCVSANGVTSPFGAAVGGTAGGALGSAAAEQAGIDGLGGAAITVAGSLAGAYAGNQVGSAISNLFGGDDAENVDPNATPGSEEANAIAEQKVPVTDSLVTKQTTSIRVQTTSIRQEEEKANKKEGCLDRIAQWAAITAMDKITLATLNWINSGFAGKPFYVENPEQFFSDLATKELLGFSATYSANEELYPFGKILSQTILLSFQRTAQQNFVNSLNNVLAHGTRQQWEADFSVGGWAGYTAYIEPNNNIFGSYLESSQNIQRRLEGTRTSVGVNFQRELQQGLGFLSQRVCSQTQNGGEYIPDNNIQHITVGVPEITEISQIPTNVYTYILSCEDTFDVNGDGVADESGMCESEFDEDVIAIAENFRGRSICTRWSTNTPGNVIAGLALDAVTTPQKQAALVDEVQENVGLILDALILQLADQGLAAFNKNNTNNVVAQQVNGENPGAAGNTTTFISAVNGFGESTENQFGGIIPMQEEYIEKVTTLLDLYDQVVQRTLDLDYCIPGPNPLWQQGSASAISQVFTLIPAYESIAQSSWVQNTSEIFPGMTSFVAAFSPTIDNGILFDNINSIYALILKHMTGFSFNSGALSPQINARQTLVNKMYGAFDVYATLINQRFTNANDFNGNIRQIGYGFFSNLGAVQSSVADYVYSLQTAQNSLQQLINLREQYADIEYQYIVEQLQIAIFNQGIQSLSDNLILFESFTPAQVTYIGSNGQPSAYQVAVQQLEQEMGQDIAPPPSYSGYSAILESFVNVLPNTANQSHIDSVDSEIEDQLNILGDQTDIQSLTGALLSCVQQVTETGPYLNVPFAGYEERVEYPFPISTDFGLPLLSTTDTFLDDVTLSPQEQPFDITIPLTPLSEIESPDDLQTFESMFLNIGETLF